MFWGKYRLNLEKAKRGLRKFLDEDLHYFYSLTSAIRRKE
jgi:hypothetical protein